MCSPISRCDISRIGRLVPSSLCEPPIHSLGDLGGWVGLYFFSRIWVFQFRGDETLKPLLWRRKPWLARCETLRAGFRSFANTPVPFCGDEA